MKMNMDNDDRKPDSDREAKQRRRHHGGGPSSRVLVDVDGDEEKEGIIIENNVVQRKKNEPAGEERAANHRTNRRQRLRRLEEEEQKYGDSSESSDDEDLYPGAIHVGGTTATNNNATSNGDDDGETMDGNTTASSAPIVLTAHLVDEDAERNEARRMEELEEEIRQLRGERDQGPPQQQHLQQDDEENLSTTMDTSKRRICYILTFVLLVIIIVTTVGLVLFFVLPPDDEPDDKTASPTTSEPTTKTTIPSQPPTMSPTTPVPTAITWNILGGDTFLTSSLLDGSSFGSSVAISGNGMILAVGSPTAHDDNSGQVEIFEYNDNLNVWEDHMGSSSHFKGDKVNSRFGHSVALSDDGTIMVVGTDPLGEQSPEYVKVFQYLKGVNQWTLMGGGELFHDEIVIDAGGEPSQEPVTHSNTGFGSSVAISGNGKLIAVGASYTNIGVENMGRVLLFEYNENISRWERFGEPIEGRELFAEMGTSVALSLDGSTLAAGAIISDAFEPGYVEVHRRRPVDDTSIFEELSGGDIWGQTPDDRFGRSVALSGDGTVVVGGGSANVRALRHDDELEKWIQMGPILFGERLNDSFGGTVAISADGTIIASHGSGLEIVESVTVGDETIVGYESVEYVTTLKFDSILDDWVKHGQVLSEDNDEQALLPKYIRTIALSSDGQTLAIGGSTSLVGQVRVYNTRVL